MYSGELGGKQESYLCDMQPPILINNLVLSPFQMTDHLYRLILPGQCFIRSLLHPFKRFEDLSDLGRLIRIMGLVAPDQPHQLLRRDQLGPEVDPLQLVSLRHRHLVMVDLLGSAR